VLRARRLDLPAFLARELDRQAIAGGIRLDARVVEHHREHAHRLADGLLLESRSMELSHQSRDRLRIDTGYRQVTKTRQDAP
jgi:hypothetical protein